MFNPNTNYRVIKQNGRVAIFKRAFMALNWSMIGIYPTLRQACDTIKKLEKGATA